jgi:CDP-diacylglycerol--serine O-phosphatidyltransferase
MPNFFTIGNMFCGFMCVIFALVQNNIIWASWMIFLAAFMDALDGKVARLANASSKFGVEYDSLADNISFGLAPSILIYQFYFSTWGTIGIFISFFPLLFGSIRLARFNVQLDGFDKSEFVGLPTPAAATLLAGYILFLSRFFPGEIFPRVLLLLTLSASVLMVSTISYDVLRLVPAKRSFLRKLMFAAAVIAITALFFYPKVLAFPYVLLYVLSGFVRFLYRLAKGKGINPYQAAD